MQTESATSRLCTNSTSLNLRKVSNSLKLNLEQNETKRKEQEEHKRKEDEKRHAKKIKKINEEREAIMNQRSQQKDESNNDWRFNQPRDYGSDRRDSNGEPDPYERRWVVGTTISNDGTVINSPGLNQMVKDIEKLKVRPTLPQKSIKKFNSVAKMNAKALFDQQMEKIALVLGKDFKLKEEDLLKMKQEREHKQKVISRFADMSKPPEPKEPVEIEALLDEIKGILEGRKTSGILSDATKNIKLKKDKKRVLTVQDPYILPHDIAQEFEN